MFRKSNNLQLIRQYLINCQNVNNSAINNAYNDLLIEEEDFKLLRDSIDNYDNFDNIQLATRLSTHDLLEFRRISSYLYRKNKKYKQSIELSKKDKLYKDAIETANESRDVELAEELLKWFVENQLKESFSACLYVCYELLKPDIVLEIAWRNQLMDYAMPYLIQFTREYSQRVEELEKKQVEVKDEPSIIQPPVQMNQPLMLTQSPWGYQPQQQQPMQSQYMYQY